MRRNKYGQGSLRALAEWIFGLCFGPIERGKYRSPQR
jgi:hypothetical protein